MNWLWDLIGPHTMTIGSGLKSHCINGASLARHGNSNADFSWYTSIQEVLLDKGWSWECLMAELASARPSADE